VNAPEPAARPAAGLDAEILERALAALDAGSGASVESLSAEFPGREDEVRAVVAALSSYRELLADAQRHGAQRRPAVLATGAQLGDFTIHGVLGIGAMGIVYRASQGSLGDRAVALKVLPRGVGDRDPRFVERFRREASLAARLHHPNVAEVFGFAPDGEAEPFFAMRLIEGRTLHEVLTELAAQRRAEQGMATDLVQGLVRLVRQLADALAAIHALGLVHRDVKPANVILEGAGRNPRLAALEARPVLVDFGLLRPIGASPLTATRTAIGTPAYAAPEARLGREVDARADVFSLGTVLHDLLTLTAPGERDPASAGLPPIRALNPAVDERLAAIVRIATEERPALRYAGGAALRDELDAWLGHGPIRALPGSALGRARLWARRHPVTAVKATALAGILALLFAAFGAWAWLTTARLGRTASTAARLEADGDLRAAAAQHRVLHDDRELGRYLVWLRPAFARAALWFESPGETSPLARLRAALETEDPDGFAVAHDRIHEFLLDPALREHRELARRFLGHEIEHGGADWRRALALETLADLLLFEPDDRELAEASRPHIDGILAGPEAGSQPLTILRAAVAALGGMLDERAFAFLLPWIRHEDDELARIAVQGSIRIWDRVNLVDGGAIDPELVERWVEAVWDRAEADRRRPARIWPVPGTFENHGVDVVRKVALQRSAGRGVPVVGTRPEVERAIASLESGFRVMPAGRTAALAFVPTGTLWFDAIVLWRRDVLFVPYWTKADYEWVYDPEIWIAAPTAVAVDLAPAAAATASPEGVDLHFGRPFARGPSLTGREARGARWAHALHERTPFGSLAGYLKFDRPGSSHLELRAAIPDGARRALIRYRHCRAARWPIPFAGRCRFRISAQDGLFELRGDAPSGAVLGEIELGPAELAGRDELRVAFELLSGNTTYRIYEVAIEWR
jgi:serine/threonine protein kinase